MSKSVLEIPPENLTPGMKQYRQVKSKHPDCLVMLRMGDFYEMFYEDAEVASRELDITLTARGQGEKRAPLAGVPIHAVESYLGKLVKKGYKVAIVEQLEDPKKAKGLIKRGLVRIVTAGTLIESSLLSEKENNYLISLAIQKNLTKIATADISTGDIILETASSLPDLFSYLTACQPSEILMPQALSGNDDLIRQLENISTITRLDDNLYRYEHARREILSFFNLSSLDSFQLENDHLGIAACGSLLSYIEQTHQGRLNHIKKIVTSSGHRLLIDARSFRNLEITKSISDNSRRFTLLDTIDRTRTPMGARLLVEYLRSPVQDIKLINDRLDAISDIRSSPLRLSQLIDSLGAIHDIERLIAKINTSLATPRDLLSLRNSLTLLPTLLVQLSANEKSSFLLRDISTLNTHDQLSSLLHSAISDDAPSSTRDARIFISSYHPELTGLRNLLENSAQIISQIEESEKKNTGISSLKVGYTRVFGYYLEVPRRHSDKIPPTYHRRQTTASTERYITAELKEIEDKILTAEDRLKLLEYDLFIGLCQTISSHTSSLQDTARKIAQLDVLCSLARVSLDYNYCRPLLNNDNFLSLQASRHPVIEHLIPRFIENDIELEPSAMMILTGPNMAGKSTIMRQCALIILLAHIGSFVPARHARIPLTDKIFSRVGAQDDIAAGQSTFLVEMNEAAHIVHNATPRSFIILDEIGRGTSTFDGVSLAWSIAEYIYHHLRSQTIFATHYHILNNLSENLPRIKNYNVAVEESPGGITFLHTLVSGGTDQSYGIHVARLAGLPAEIIERAGQIQTMLEKDDRMIRLLKAKRLEDQKSLTQY